MSVFKVQYTKNGRAKRSGNFYLEFRDHTGIRRRVPGFKDKRATEQLERNLEQLVAARVNGVLPSPDLARAVETLPAKLRNRLADWGVLDAGRRHSGKSIEEHLQDFKAELQAKGASDKWTSMVYFRALRVLEAAGCRTLQDITEGRIVVAADKLREAKGLSMATHNHGLAACKAFTRWATPERMSVDPLSKLKGRNARAHRVHERRALTAEEARALLAAAEAGPVWFGVSGPDRAMAYRMALETGLRANEIATLTRNAFDLDPAQPTVTVEARHAKNRKAATLPINPELAGALRVHLQGKHPAALAFHLPKSSHTAEMIRADLKAAGIEYETDQGFADFHSLRHTFITNLARAGVMPNEAKELARHSSITLTMDYYTHTRLGSLAAAVAKLPSLNTPKAETA